MAEFVVNPNAAGTGQQTVPAASLVKAEQLQAELRQLGEREAAIKANENRRGTIRRGEALLPGTVGLTMSERLALVSVEERIKLVQQQLAQLATGQQSAAVGDHGALPAPAMLPMWQADP